LPAAEFIENQFPRGLQISDGISPIAMLLYGLIGSLYNTRRIRLDRILFEDEYDK
jgi:hypothetical protein